MKNIYDLKINRSGGTLGISPDDIMFSFKAKRGNDFSLSLLNNGETSVFTGVDGVCVRPDYKFGYGEKYTVTAANELGDSESLEFETATDKSGEWIAAAEELQSAVFRKTFCSDGGEVRIKITGLGLYRAFLNGERIGNDWLTPMMNDYDDCVRAQTYEIMLLKGENTLEISVGKGWYSGQFGIDGGFSGKWGKELAVNAVIYDGGSVIAVTDKSWQYSSGKILGNGIYYGEDRDDNTEYSFKPVKKAEKEFKAVPDYSAPIRTVEERSGTLIITPKNEKIIDFGQNGAGVVRFKNHFPKGTRVVIRYSEVLQDGCFYRDNLRTARAEYRYVSDGDEGIIEPYFTYYGFRYVMVECDADWSVSDFTAVYFSTSLSETAELETNCELLNKLISNAGGDTATLSMYLPTARKGTSASAGRLTRRFSCLLPAISQKHIFSIRNLCAIWRSTRRPITAGIFRCIPRQIRGLRVTAAPCGRMPELSFRGLYTKITAIRSFCASITVE